MRSAAALAAFAAALLAGELQARAQNVPAQPAPAATATAVPASPAATTALEAWLLQPGRVVVERTRSFAPLPLAGDARVALEAVVAFEPVREHERALGLRVRLLGTQRAGRDALAYLDAFEIDDLARTLAALPGLEKLERAGEPVEIRHVSRDGFGVVVAVPAGAAPPRRALRFRGDPPLDLLISDAALAELRAQLDAARSFLFAP